MFKKLLAAFLRRVILPLLRLFCEEVLKQIANWLIGKTHEMLGKWRKEEQDAASTDEERAAIARKYDKREADLVVFEREIPGKLKDVIHDAITEAGKHAGGAIEVATVEDTKRLNAGESNPKKKKRKS
jgi:hypothetical protein